VIATDLVKQMSDEAYRNDEVAALGHLARLRRMHIFDWRGFRLVWWASDVPSHLPKLPLQLTAV
jgi:hypothetical protein